MLKARARVVEDEHKGRAAPPLDLKVRDPPRSAEICIKALDLKVRDPPKYAGRCAARPAEISGEILHLQM